MCIGKINEYKVNVQKSIGFLCTIYTKIRQLNFYNYNLKYHQIHRDKSNKRCLKLLCSKLYTISDRIFKNLKKCRKIPCS